MVSKGIIKSLFRSTHMTENNKFNIFQIFNKLSVLCQYTLID